MNLFTVSSDICKTSCRICLTKCLDMSNIFIEANKNIIQHIHFCTGIMLKQDDNLPTEICKNCLNSLSDAYKFKTMCLLSEQMCQKLLRNIKIEASDNVNENYFDINNGFVNDNKMYELTIIHKQENVLSNVKEEAKDECKMKTIPVDLIESLDVQGKSLRQPNERTDNENIKENNVKVVKKRGPYKKKGVASIKKFKFSRLVCEPCGLKFTTIQESDKHKQEMHAVDSYMNDNENIKENSVKVGKKRGPYKKRGAPSIKKFKFNRLVCEPCGLKFTTIQESDKHKQDMHALDSYMTDNENIEENNVKVGKKRGPYKKKGPRTKKYKFTRLVCEPCGLKFTTRKESVKHKQEMHAVDSYMCEVCGKTFPRRSSHYTHVRSHLPPTYSCDSCDYRTAHKYDLQKHLRIHLGIKKYQCKACSACYRTSSNLREHERRQHLNLRRFQCHICEKQFFDSTKLNIHVDAHMNIKRFECDLCHTAFTRRCYWKKHLDKQHSIVVPTIRPGRRKNNIVVTDVAIEQPE